MGDNISRHESRSSLYGTAMVFGFLLSGALTGHGYLICGLVTVIISSVLRSVYEKLNRDLGVEMERQNHRCTSEDSPQ